MLTDIPSKFITMYKQISIRIYYYMPDKDTF